MREVHCKEPDEADVVYQKADACTLAVGGVGVAVVATGVISSLLVGGSSTAAPSAMDWLVGASVARVRRDWFVLGWNWSANAKLPPQSAASRVEPSPDVLRYRQLVGSILLVVPSDLKTSDRWGAELRRSGYEVLLALTWREAYRKILMGGIDVVVIDSFDPRLGYEQLARTIGGVRDAPPILLVSSSPSAPALCAEIGGSVCLPKPCDPRALIELIKQLVGDKNTNDEFKETTTAEFQLTT